MANAVIIIILVLVIIFAVKNSVKHFKGEGGCCGGGGEPVTKREIPDKTLKGPKIGEKSVSISGMHCDHCVMAVTKAINRIDGASAKVNLKQNRAVVSYDRPISDAAIKAAVEAEGFQVIQINEL